MSDPYRDSAFDLPAEAPRDEGLVGDVIAQFADPKAFFRELVQNAIDAGSPAIDVKLEYDEATQRMRASVKDRGCGMTREVIENQLLVLFRSTKEKDKTKIGKFGIGFMSVLSPNPEVVAVHSSRDGRKLTLHLYRDLSYELFDGGPSTQVGTTVELEIALPREEVAVFVRDSELSLVRWCRHASVPIELAIRTPIETATRRIDRPLGIADALVEVRATADDGQLTVVAALLRQGAPYVGFFNHGLMLFETMQPMLGAYSVKIQDARLGHTISRDDVRRDGHFDHAVEFAKRVIAEDLGRAIAKLLHDTAEAHDLKRHGELVRAVRSAERDIPASYWHFPLVHPIGGKRSISGDQCERFMWTALRESELTRVLAAAGTPVLLGYPTTGLSDRPARDVEDELTAITPIETTDEDDALIALLREIFDNVHREPEAIVLAKLSGARADRIAIAGLHEVEHVVDREDAVRDPFALLRRRVLVLSAEHPAVRAARTGDPIMAASHLARAVLLQNNLLDEKRSRKILEHALERIGVAR